MRNARVFISCGQRDEREINIGLKICDYFNSRDFKTYFAARVHSPEALTEDIFRALNESEYFLFIDFEREEISNSLTRGSLFVAQEIAIATFLKIPGLGFYERRIKREGILNYQIYNALPFSTEAEILDQIERETKEWDNNSVNELRLSHNPNTVSRNYIAKDLHGKPKTDWWHIQVKNCHKSKHALSCMAYLSTIKNLEDDKVIPFPGTECPSSNGVLTDSSISSLPIISGCPSRHSNLILETVCSLLNSPLQMINRRVGYPALSIPPPAPARP